MAAGFARSFSRGEAGRRLGVQRLGDRRRAADLAHAQHLDRARRHARIAHGDLGANLQVSRRLGRLALPHRGRQSGEGEGGGESEGSKGGHRLTQGPGERG